MGGTAVAKEEIDTPPPAAWDMAEGTGLNCVLKAAGFKEGGYYRCLT
jgi:hypothetical protein